jgi:glycosyltransferase involved in cell wall biosynthesis
LSEKSVSSLIVPHRLRPALGIQGGETLRICLYSTTALPKIGGQEMVVDALARHYQAHGHEVVVLAPMPRRPLRPRDSELPYRVVRHPRMISTRYLVDWYSRWLVRLQRQVGFDLVHAHGVYAAGYLATRCRERIGVPVVVTSHGDDVFMDNPRFRCPIIRPRICRTVRQADHLVAISSFTREGYLQSGADPERITVIPNGVDPEPLRQPAPRPADLPDSLKAGQYVLFLGRLVRRKGVDVLLSALARLPARSGLELVIAGSGEELEPLRELAHRMGLGGRVYFTGAVGGDTKNYLLQNARCLAAPSRTWEAQGLVVLEAFAAGAPVIASRLKGLADLIDQDRTGWLVPPEDPEALAQPLAKALSWPVREAMRAHLRKVVARFTWPVIAARHLDLFADLLRGAPVPLEREAPTPARAQGLARGAA